MSDPQTDAIDEVARRAYVQWRLNGHDVLAAVWHVHHEATDPRVKLAAREEGGRMGFARFVQDSYRMRFEAWEQGEQ